MKILAIDTATQTCSAAIVDDDAVVVEIIRDRGGTHTRVLMKMVDEMFSAAGMRPADIDGFAVTIGPGSFTGLRIGLATVKGLAFARNRPIAGISTLDALVAPIPGVAGRVCAMIDARRGEVYTALYRFDSPRWVSEGPARAESPQKAVAAIHGPTVFVGDGALAYKDVITAGAKCCAFPTDPGQHVIRASVVAGLGLDRILSGHAGDAFTLTPLYLRKSDARK